MKKRIYFIISSILQIITSIYSIFNADKLTKLMLESLNGYPDEMIERMETLFNNSGNTYIIGIALLCILLNIIILIINIRNKHILRKKGALLTCSTISFFSSTNSIIELLSLLNIIILLLSKREKKEDYPIREKKELPVLDRIDNSKKDIILAIILLLVYFSQFIWSLFIPENITLSKIVTINVIFDIIMLILVLIIFYPKFKRDFISFKNNHKAYFSFVLPKLGIMYLIYFGVSFVSVSLAQSSTSINQETLESLPLLYTIPAAILWAPIVEEILFRGCIRRFIKNNTIYIIVSALIFGLLHTINETSLLNMLALTIPYATLGGFYAYLYSKTDNILNNILCHSFHNTVAILITILIVG